MGITITNNYNNIPIVYTGNTKDNVLQTESDGTVRFDRELAKVAYSGQPSFGKAMTREEFLQSLDAKLEENKRLYGKTEADWIKEQCPNWQTMKFKFAGEDKLYGYYEFIKELDRRSEENREQ